MEEKTKSLYVDSSECNDLINVDDFVVTIGAKKSNSVYHVAEVRYRHFPEKGIMRNYLKVYVSDLPTALSRESDQKLIPMVWYKRSTKKVKPGIIRASTNPYTTYNANAKPIYEISFRNKMFL